MQYIILFDKSFFYFIPIVPLFIYILFTFLAHLQYYWKIAEKNDKIMRGKSAEKKTYFAG